MGQFEKPEELPLPPKFWETPLPTPENAADSVRNSINKRKSKTPTNIVDLLSDKGKKELLIIDQDRDVLRERNNAKLTAIIEAGYTKTREQVKAEQVTNADAIHRASARKEARERSNIDAKNI